jgi:hypothetical protein
LIGREIRFEARGFDAAGKQIARAELMLDTSSYLPLGESLAIALGARCEKVTVVGSHLDPRHSEALKFLEVQLPR